MVSLSVYLEIQGSDLEDRARTLNLLPIPLQLEL